MTPPNSLDPADLLMELMSIDSTSGREHALVDWLTERLAVRGWMVTRIPVSDGRDDILATTGSAPVVTLSTHLDTVPPFVPPARSADRISGRGACDAKGLAAAMICAGERLRATHKGIALLFVVGEEVSHDGAHAANEFALRHGIQPRALINGEPTESKLAVGTKGASRVVVRTEGTAAHSAYPQLGKSATLDLVRMLAELETLELPRDELLGDTTINIGGLAGGVADNVVAPWAEARLMIRLVTPVREVAEILDRWADGRASLEWGVTVPPVRLGALAGFEHTVAAYATDIPALDAWGTPYLFGPGSIHVAHRPDEYIDIEELRRAVDSYVAIAEQLLEQ